MNKAAVLTDTVTEMTREITDQYNIRLTPINVVADGSAVPLRRVFYHPALPPGHQSQRTAVHSILLV